MSTLIEIERPVFLHFLDQEASLSFGSERSERTDIEIIHALVLFHISGFSVNLHPLTMYLNERQKLLDLILKLNRYDILLNTSSDRSVPSFLRTRQEMYGLDPASKPIFFQNADSVLDFQIHKTNSYSMTDKIRGEIFSISGRRFPDFAVRATLNDKEEFFLHLDEVQRVLFEYDYLAITTDNILAASSSNMLDEKFANSSRRVLSALYYEHYCDNNLTVTASGIPKMNSSADDLAHFPHYDIAVLQRMIVSLGLLEPLGRASANLELFETYYSEEHWRFVSSAQAFIAACYAQALATIGVAHVTPDNAQTLRIATVNVLMAVLNKAIGGSLQPDGPLLEAYRRIDEALFLAGEFGSQGNRHFAHTWQNSSARSSFVPLVGFSRLERRLTALRNELQRSGDLTDHELADLMQPLAVLLNYSGQLLIDNSIDRVINEAEFQDRIRQVLRSNPRIGEALEQHPQVGAGIADLSFKGIRIELKSVSDKRLKLADCRKYIDQASSYSTASGRKVSILCVLDCSKKSSVPYLAEDCVSVMYPKDGSRTPVVVILMQGNLAPPSMHSR